MRMFLIGMCDIFLILYLTAITNVQPATILTVDDFYKLKSIHETLKADKQKTNEELKDKLRRAQEEKDILMAEKQKQEELAAARLRDLSDEKENLKAKVTEEKERLTKLEESLLFSDAERERINKNLQKKEEMLKAREQLLANLNKDIAAKEEAQRKMEFSYQKELENKRQTIEESRQLAEKLQSETRNAQHLVEKMQVEVLEARQEAEVEKESVLIAMEVAKMDRKKAEQNAERLIEKIRDIKQDGETAYNNKIRPQLQKVKVTYERRISSGTIVYERELTLLPVKVDEKIYVVFSSRQIGFSARSDKAPDRLVITYQGKRVKSGLLNKDDNLIAISLSGYEGDAYTIYPVDTKLTEFMPALLALRNNGNVSLSDKIRGISDRFFIVNRDYLKSDKGHRLTYAVKGFRGTGTRGERIVRGDQLVDLNGRLIGVASNTNRVIRINTLSGWGEIAL